MFLVALWRRLSAMPFAIGPIVGFAVFVALMVGGWFVVDAIGDQRETIVVARLQPQIDRAEHERDEWKAAHQKLLDDAERLNVENQEKLKGALAAKAAAEQMHGGAIAQPERVRGPAKRGPTQNSNGGGGSGLFGIWPLPWTPGKG